MRRARQNAMRKSLRARARARAYSKSLSRGYYLRADCSIMRAAFLGANLWLVLVLFFFNKLSDVKKLFR